MLKLLKCVDHYPSLCLFEYNSLSFSVSCWRSVAYRTLILHDTFRIYIINFSCFSYWRWTSFSLACAFTLAIHVTFVFLLMLSKSKSKCCGWTLRSCQQLMADARAAAVKGNHSSLEMETVLQRERSQRSARFPHIFLRPSLQTTPPLSS